MRRTLAITLLLATVLLGGGGLDGSAAAATPVPAHGVRPPTWLQREVLWQSLSAGVAHPGLCRWLLTSPARAARLAGRPTSFLRSFPGVGRVWVVVVDGHFPNGRGAKANRLYLVMEARDHACLVQGITSARHLHLRPLGRLHRFVPRQSLGSGLWGQAMIEGGAVSGRPVATGARGGRGLAGRRYTDDAAALHSGAFRLGRVLPATARGGHLHPAAGYRQRRLPGANHGDARGGWAGRRRRL